MKLSDITGHLVTLGLASVVACSGAKPTPDASALNDQPKAAPQAEATPVTPEQYHLALGQRRADSAKKYLAGLGVKPLQITAISFGAEKPKAQGHDEEAWKQNRRDDVSAQR